MKLYDVELQILFKDFEETTVAESTNLLHHSLYGYIYSVSNCITKSIPPKSIPYMQHIDCDVNEYIINLEQLNVPVLITSTNMCLVSDQFPIIYVDNLTNSYIENNNKNVEILLNNIDTQYIPNMNVLIVVVSVSIIIMYCLKYQLYKLFKYVKYQRNNRYLENVRYVGEMQNDACSICLDDFKQNEKVSQLVCEHVFHKECIKKWIIVNDKEPLCPNCNMKIFNQQRCDLEQPLI